MMWLSGAVVEEPPVVPPVPVEAAPPVLPEEARALEEPVVVVVRITVDTAGEVSQAEIMQSGGRALDRAALRAAVHWRFEPARRGSEPVEVQADIPITFTPPTAPVASAEPAPAEPQPEPKAPLTPESTASAEPAAEGAPPAAQQGSSAPSFSTLVRTRAAPPPPAAAGDFHIEVGRLADVPRGSATDLLTLAPGVMLTNHGGEGHADRVFIRGADAGEGKDVEFRLQGVPLNEVSHAHGHGYAETYFIIPELVDSLRVTEGPYDPAQGDFGVAGTVEYQLALRQRGLVVGASQGNYNARRLTLLWGPPEASEHTFVGLLLRQGDGFGPNRSYSNITAMGQAEFNASESVRLRLLAASSAARWLSAGVLRETDVVDGRLPCGPSADEQFFCLYDPDQGGSTQRHLASAELQTRLSRGGRFTQQLFGVMRQSRLRENFTGFLQDVRPDGQPQRGDNTELFYTGATVGLRGRYVPGLTVLGQPQPLELGYVVRYDDVETRSRRIRDQDQRSAPYLTVFDNRVRVTNIGAYASGRLSPLPWLSLRGGVRVDTFAFGVEDRNRPAQDREGPRLTEEAVEAYGFALSPRLTAEVKLNPQLTWITSAGLGARSSDAAALSDSELAPFAEVASAETGLGWVLAGESLPFSLEARGALFATRVSQDFVFDAAAGRNQPVGASQRVGAFASARLRMGEHADVQASLAWARASLPAAGAEWWRLLEGELQPYIPQLMGRVDASVWGTLQVGSEPVQWNVALGHGTVAPRPLPLNRFGEPIILFDVAGRARWRWLEVGVVVDNLFDARWREAEFNYVSNFRGPEAAPSLVATRHFSAGAPRMVRGTLTLYWDMPREEQP